MKTLSLNLKTHHLIFVTILMTGVLACKKENTETRSQTPIQIIDVTKLSDSISYTLDGVTYTCNVLTGEGGGNAGANLDTANGEWKWDVDTLQYQKNYTYSVSSDFMGANGGRMVIHFVKKFAKPQLTRTVAPGILGPVSDTLLYLPKGVYPFAVDFQRFNSQNGIVLELDARSSGNLTQRLLTYAVQSPRWATTITDDIQKDSKFEITNVSYIPAYKGYWNCHLLEATFSCKVFDRNETPHLVNGYIRIHVD